MIYIWIQAFNWVQKKMTFDLYIKDKMLKLCEGDGWAPRYRPPFPMHWEKT